MRLDPLLLPSIDTVFGIGSSATFADLPQTHANLIISTLDIT